MKYKSLDEVEIEGRGKLFIVENEKDRTTKDLIGKEVLIDDKRYKVKGVETFFKTMIIRGEKIGLLV